MKYLILLASFLSASSCFAITCADIESLMSQYSKDRYFMVCMDKLMVQYCDKPDIDTFYCGSKVGLACLDALNEWQGQVSVAWAACVTNTSN